MKNKATINKIVSHIKNTMVCIEKHCAAEKKKLQAVNMKYRKERMNLFKSNMSNKQFMQKMLAINKKINKTEEKIKSTECQLNKCYKETHDMIMISIDKILKRINKKTEPKKYEIIMKYKKLFSKKIEVKDLIKFDEISFTF